MLAIPAVSLRRACTEALQSSRAQLRAGPGGGAFFRRTALGTALRPSSARFVSDVRCESASGQPSSRAGQPQRSLVATFQEGVPAGVKKDFIPPGARGYLALTNAFDVKEALKSAFRTAWQPDTKSWCVFVATGDDVRRVLRFVSEEGAIAPA